MAQDFLSLIELKAQFDRLELSDSDKFRFLSTACDQGMIQGSGIRQLALGVDFAASYEREPFLDHMWRMFAGAFEGNVWRRSTIEEIDWHRGFLKYRWERDPADGRPPLDVQCGIWWARGSAHASFSAIGGGSERTEMQWRSVLFDAPSVKTFLARVAGNMTRKTRKPRADAIPWELVLQKAEAIRRDCPQVKIQPAALSIVSEIPNHPKTGKPRDYREIEKRIAPLWIGGEL